MPTKRLPRKLVQKLRHYAKQGILGTTTLGQMKNADHRINPEKPPAITGFMGFRVREMNVSRSFPKTKLIIKRVHSNDAKTVLAKIKRAVTKHNTKFRNEKTYSILSPIAYPLHGELIAMAKTTAPSIEEIVGDKSDSAAQTPRGKEFIKKLIVKHGVSQEQFQAAARKAVQRTGIHNANMLFLGYQKEKFIFMPLVDLF
ncbi:MAG: hypothetical protein WCW13_02890 [archaeon]|jgi:hypothetical protein